MSVITNLVGWIVGGLLFTAVPISYGAHPDSGFWPYFRRDPYCLLDPTCVNPLGGVSHGRDSGFARNDFQDQNHLSGLAAPNYILFLSTFSALAFIITTRIAHRRVRHLLLTILFVWVCLEVNRWFASMNTSFGSTTEELQWLLGHLGVEASSLLTVVLAVRLGVRMRRG